MSNQSPEPCPPPIDTNQPFMTLPELPSTLTELYCPESPLVSLPVLPLSLYAFYEDQPPPTTELHTPPIGETPFYCAPTFRNPIKTPKQKRIETREQKSKEAKRRREDAGLSEQQLANKYCPNRDWQCGCWHEGGC